MKRIILSVAILAVAASCSKNEVVDIPQTNAIGFSTLNDRVTKVANDVVDAKGYGVDYKVYALNSVANTAWTIDDVVSGEDNTADGGPYYWPTDGSSLAFYAYAPADTENTSSPTTTAGTVTMTYTVPTDAQEDFTVATPITSQTTDVVAFQFQHMLAKVEVVVILSDDLDINHTLGDTHTASVSVYDNASAINVVEGSSTPSVADNKTGAASIKYSEAVLTYYIMPQAIAGCVLEIDDITITLDSNSSYLYDKADLAPIKLTSENVPTFTTFDAGKHYVFTITVGDDATTEEGDELEIIKFSATSASWGDGIPGSLDQE